MNKDIQASLQKIYLPANDSHKGQNGKLLIIGGSKLFHAASLWSTEVASKIVDMVFYASIPENNELILALKKEFKNGIVVRRQDIKDYIDEADCVLIGPGMERHPKEDSFDYSQELTQEEWNFSTQKVVNYLLFHYPQKRFVIDAGALQMMDPKLLNNNCLITPHSKEIAYLIHKEMPTQDYSQELNLATILLKGPIDKIISAKTYLEIEGGNPGMTKGGTGDCLAGLVAALYCKNDILTSAIVASYINKKAGDLLYQEFGPFFSASDLAGIIAKTLWQEIKQS